MCLADVTGTPKKVSGLGWKTFGTDEQGKLIPSNRGYQPYEYDVWYNAEARANEHSGVFRELGTERNGRIGFQRTYYRNGFHVCLRREDARAFTKKEDDVVRQVEYRGAHTAGNGSSYIPGPQVVVTEIKILRPRLGGSAYAKKAKRGDVKPITDPTASVEAAVAAE